MISKLTFSNKTALMAFRLQPSRLHILYRGIVIPKCCLNKYSNTEICFK